MRDRPFCKQSCVYRIPATCNCFSSRRRGTQKSQVRVENPSSVTRVKARQVDEFSCHLTTKHIADAVDLWRQGVCVLLLCSEFWWAASTSRCPFVCLRATAYRLHFCHISVLHVPFPPILSYLPSRYALLHPFWKHPHHMRTVLLQLHSFHQNAVMHRLMCVLCSKFDTQWSTWPLSAPSFFLILTGWPACLLVSSFSMSIRGYSIQDQGRYAPLRGR